MLPEGEEQNSEVTPGQCPAGRADLKAALPGWQQGGLAVSPKAGPWVLPVPQHGHRSHIWLSCYQKECACIFLFF